MSFQVSDAMRSLVPNAKLHIINEDYDTMQWDASNTDTKPTKAEVEADIFGNACSFLLNRFVYMMAVL